MRMAQCLMEFEKMEDLMVVGPLYFLTIKVSTMGISFQVDVMGTGLQVRI